MIKIPDEAVEAAKLAAAEYLATGVNHTEEKLFSAAITAALNAWPGMSQLEENDSASIREMAALILPLPQEASDDK